QPYFDEIQANTSLIADPSANVLYLTVGKDILYVKDIGTTNASIPTALPSVSDITIDNANKVIELIKLIRGSMSQLACSPDEKTLAIGGSFPYLAQYDQPTVWFYDLNKLQARPQLFQMDTQGVPGLSAENVVFSPDGRTLAATGWDSTISLWDVANNKQI